MPITMPHYLRYSFYIFFLFVNLSPFILLAADNNIETNNANENISQEELNELPSTSGLPEHLDNSPKNADIELIDSGSIVYTFETREEYLEHLNNNSEITKSSLGAYASNADINNRLIVQQQIENARQEFAHTNLLKVTFSLLFDYNTVNFEEANQDIKNTVSVLENYAEVIRNEPGEKTTISEFTPDHLMFDIPVYISIEIDSWGLNYLSNHPYITTLGFVSATN